MKPEQEALQEFALILERFSSSIKAIIFKYGLDRLGIDPDDAFQEIRIKIWKKCTDEKKIRNPASYIMKLINSTLIDLTRKVRHQEKIFDHEKQKMSVEEIRQPGYSSDDEIHKDIVREAVESLLETRRKVVKLFLMDLTLDEIAISLDWSKEKTRNLLYRGLADLKEKLKERGIDYEDRQQ